ncbi:cell envelope biogenesis protein LolA [Patiriisocius marinistellae]|uniref:Cell envelope biogenesis protein LolA n=1 Tax=Patiriisocius marinistellae TaxID=2494560 RepID=A0A5J4FYJ4_9FLAO|nr:outer membrane lipoprotein carrier protein LolA [Patiriisocius marinistellae]GEQ85239.1 cell envelope biogenesis protein LolA [Patiriisocius marinistellae]
MYKLIIILLLGCFSTQVMAQERVMTASEISAFKTAVIETSRASKTIKSDFIQYKHLDFLDNDIETIGKLQFKAPGFVKWEYTKPYVYSVIFREDKLLINDGGTKNAIDIGSSKMFKKLNDLIVKSVKGDMFDDNDFTVTYFITDKANKAVFVPKDKKLTEYIASFELLFDKKEASVTEVKMIEPSQDYTQIIFKNRLVNTTINDAVFTQ